MYVNERFRVSCAQSRNRHSIAIAVVCLAFQCLIVTASSAQPPRPLDPLAHQLQPNQLVVYKLVADRELKLHIFEPEGHSANDRRSVFLIVHGGGWAGGYPWRVYPFADYFRRQGMVAISLEYRLLNKPKGTTVFDCVRDGRSAVRYLRQHATELGIDPQRITVAGCSAGGHVAVGTALFDGMDEESDPQSVSPVPNAAVLYYPVIDTSADGYGQKKIGDNWKQISPVHNVQPDLPPTMVFHGTGDAVTPYAGATAFHEKMQSVGNVCELISHEDGIHGYLIFELSQFESAMKRTLEFLQQQEMLPVTEPVSATDAWAPATDQLLSLTAEAAGQLKHASELGLLEMAPVHLPKDSVGDCNYPGWPIATMTGDTIIVMHRQIPGHRAKGAGQPDPSMSYGIVLRSDDGGRTWSTPYDLRECMTPDDRLRGGIVPLSHRAKFDTNNKSAHGYKVHLHSIGTTLDGAVVAINNHGVFRSGNQGRTWKHFSMALRDDTFPHQIVNLGPRILDHATHGLMAFGNWFGEVDSYHKLSNKLVALTSADGGADVAPVSFAYPISRNNTATDETLLNVFRHLRTGKNIASDKRLCEDDAFFVPAGKIAEHGCLSAKGIDHAPLGADRTYEQIDGALERAAKNQEIIVLYAHRISESGTGNFVTPEALTRIFSKATELGLTFYTFDQLP